jgi:septum formation protein
VITGISLVHAAGKLSVTRTASTRVWLEAADEDEIETYVASGEPLDKAGAYAIQGKGAIMVKRIEGCYSNVVGLPLNLLAQTLREAGLDIWELMRGE